MIVGVLALAATLLTGGCAEEEIHFTEIRKADEPVTPEEWQAFIRIVDAMPEPKLEPLTAAISPLPQWQDARTMPVYELAAEERRSLDTAWDPAQAARRFTGVRGLSRLLGRERMTVEQFTGIALAVGLAMRRAKLSEDFPWDDLLRRGERTLLAFDRDQRLFSSLPIDVRHRVLDEAVWLHRVDRAERLQKVPAENVALVTDHADWLAKSMPEVFRKHPFEDVVDLLEERGLPFVEMPETGRDDELDWNPADAIVGIKPTTP
jgi:hypothetical protein